MKKILKEIKNKLHNTGSSLILVIVALGFVGILCGALLTAAGYVYKQKLYDYNARSNFYYLDQAMDEVYAGVGSLTMSDLMLAYEKTREEIIYFDPVSKSYVNMSESEANAKFKENFVKFLAKDESFKEDEIKKIIGSSITNSSISLDDSKLRVKYVYMAQQKGKDSGRLTPIFLERDSYVNNGLEENLAKIVIQNVKLTRTVNYNRSTAKGVFKQSISTDIEIARPDFDISFDNTIVNASTLFDYCLVADSGVDFNRITDDILTIGGNVYAANDFYNKDYNEYSAPMNDVEYPAGSGEKYKMNKVSNYSYTGNNAIDTLYNKSGYNADDSSAYRESNLYDGKNLNSKYSGFYVDGGNVNILADTVIVPGSIAVMNGGSLAVYGVESGDISDSNVWADEVVLGGYALPAGKDDKKIGSEAIFNSNLYVKDDTTIESEYSKFTLEGSYYGFGNSEQADSRRFVPTTAKQKSTDIANIYEKLVPKKDTNGNIIRNSSGDIVYEDEPENRGHYNSSAIIINGENSELDLSKAETIFIAGRSYIELSNTKTSKKGDSKKIDIDKGRKGIKSDNDLYTVEDKKYQYDPVINDYRTGESISLKSSQVAYYPNKASSEEVTYPDVTNESIKNLTGYEDGTYVLLTNESSLKDMHLITKYFGSDGMIPISVQEEQVGSSKKIYRYIDFERAVINNKFQRLGLLIDFPDNVDDLKKDINKYSNAMMQSFIQDYFNYFNFCVNPDSPYKLAYMGYEAGYDSLKNSSAGGPDYPDTAQGLADLSAAYSELNLDTYVLDKPGTNFDNRELINKRATELQNVTEFSGFEAGQIAVADNKNNNDVNIFTSGGVTSSGTEIKTLSTDEGIEFTLKSSNSDVITSELIGESNTKILDITDTSDYVKKTNTHYNYYKWALRDLDETKSGDKAAIDILDAAITANGESSITPINYYMNFDVLSSTFNDIHPSYVNESGGIVDANLTLGNGEYRVWASKGDVKISADPSSSDKEVTGIVVSKGDVFFDKNVHKFNGIIISGGKVHVGIDNKINYISSTSLCRNILNECLVKAVNYSNLPAGDDKDEAYRAIQFLKLFKDYEKLAEQAEDGSIAPDTTKKDITTVDYSDVIKYNNWLRNVD